MELGTLNPARPAALFALWVKVAGSVFVSAGSEGLGFMDCLENSFGQVSRFRLAGLLLCSSEF